MRLEDIPTVLGGLVALLGLWLLWDSATADREQRRQRERRRREHDRAMLEEMTSYAQSGQCRWRRLLEHFGEAHDFEACGSCDSCERIAAASAEAQLNARTVRPAPATAVIRPVIANCDEVQAGA